MKHTPVVTIVLVVLFVLSQVIGVIILDKYLDKDASAAAGEPVWHDLPSAGPVSFERPDVEEEWSSAYIIAAIIGGTLVLLIVMKWGRVFIWKAWFFLAVLISLFIAFGAFVAPPLAFAIALVLAGAKFIPPSRVKAALHNLGELFMYGGLAAIFVPIFNLASAIVVLIVISLYDMYAVWQSKHMVRMAEYQTTSGVFAGLAIPYARPGTTHSPPKTHHLTPSTPPSSPGIAGNTAILGGGDMAIPLFFTGTVLKMWGVPSALIIIPFTTIALIVLLALAKKDKFYPAMPFLSAGALVGFLASWIVHTAML